MDLTTQLTEIEKTEFETLEGIIERSAKSFVDVGNALLTIRDRGLFREGHKTFNDYCKAKWGMGKAYANRLIVGSQVAENLAPHGARLTPCEIQPIYEYQVRPLVILDPGQQCEIWEEAVRTADGKVVTFKQVKALVAELVAPAPPVPPSRGGARKPGFDYLGVPIKYLDKDSPAIYFASLALSQLSRITADDPTRDEAIKMVSDWVHESQTTPFTKKRSGK